MSCLMVTIVGPASPVCTSMLANPPAPKKFAPAMPHLFHWPFLSFRKTGDPGWIELKPVTCVGFAMLRGRRVRECQNVDVRPT